MSYLLLPVKHLQSDGQWLPQRPGHRVRGLHHVELHAVVHGVSMHLAQAQHPLGEPNARNNQARWIRRQEAVFARIKYPLMGHVVRWWAARIREYFRGQASGNNPDCASHKSLACDAVARPRPTRPPLVVAGTCRWRSWCHAKYALPRCYPPSSQSCCSCAFLRKAGPCT